MKQNYHKTKLARNYDSIKAYSLIIPPLYLLILHLYKNILPVTLQSRVYLFRRLLPIYSLSFVLIISQ